ncbi:MAG TPA: alkaline phosphatase family protein [Chitinophagaceae bacterium]|nr:alkaline phosphatase family protein [Chitinophagaceae bacterium]
MKVILFELNEVPYKVIYHFCKLYPESNLAKVVSKGRKYETYAEDQGHLSPWITWPTVHRGVTNEKHFIADFGQDLAEQEKQYPTVWNMLAKKGVKVGLFGSLHTHPLPVNFENFSFYVPDTFAAGSECFPKKLEPFQQFNLAMARDSSRVVSKKIPGKEAAEFLMKLPDMGLKFRTATELAAQLVDERINKWKVVRRRTCQSLISFDIFYKQLESQKPDFATFFTNHVASSQHRYWAAAFPEDYESLKLGREWVETYNGEIIYTMKKVDRMIGRLTKFMEKNAEYSLWILSSMGQQAVETREIYTDLFVTNGKTFMENFDLGSYYYELKPSMVPQFNVQIHVDKRKEFEEKLATFRINDQSVHSRQKAEGFYSLDIGFANLDESKIKIELMGQIIPLAHSGMENVKIQDRCGATAYHIPQGSLIIYAPAKGLNGNDVSTISTTDIAPTILRNFHVPVPDYMNKGIFIPN